MSKAVYNKHNWDQLTTGLTANGKGFSSSSFSSAMFSGDVCNQSGLGTFLIANLRKFVDVSPSTASSFGAMKFVFGLILVCCKFFLALLVAGTDIFLLSCCVQSLLTFIFRRFVGLFPFVYMLKYSFRHICGMWCSY